MMTATRLGTCHHDLSMQSYMVYNGQKLCLDCASALFERTKDQRLCPAYLLVHGKELDRHPR